MHRRILASGVHLLLSAAVAAAVSVLVFLVWYPSPYGVVSGGLTLFGLMVSIDVVLGPMLTAVIASPSKPIGELRRDLAFIVIVQISALAYGLFVTGLSRPVYVAFEVDRLRVVSTVDIDPKTIDEAPPGLRSLPWTGPKLIAVVKPTDPKEQLESIELALAGFDLAVVPRHWRDYASHADDVWRAARPVASLIQKYPEAAPQVEMAAAAAAVNSEQLRFLPLTSRRVGGWVSLLAEPGARVVAHLPYDGFL